MGWSSKYYALKVCFVSSVRNLSQDTADEFSSISALNPTTISYYPVQEWKYSENPSKFLFSIEYTLRYSNISALNVHHLRYTVFFCKASSLQNAEQRWRIHESSFSKIHFYVGITPTACVFFFGESRASAKRYEARWHSNVWHCGSTRRCRPVSWVEGVAWGTNLPHPMPCYCWWKKPKPTTCDVKKSCILMG